ncbi:Short-chain dehydrogenase/reductase SDR family protein [Penicillium ucsense]|uniref:Short-chain dehydrogenase/reductase SDR family protein n=1 Tax=Penicillium ucsense TaxID=2839758 RepID=A0A8J8VWE1_9EURO|nr:Short-chain dehydrogenase/reductase SDR family protein [Penicillium ucsense]KAF7729296.1 Short-chain dehydrogenase/reductase SDR family protein [Penicillium ucsense]
MLHRAIARSAVKGKALGTTSRPALLSSQVRQFSFTTPRSNNKSDDPENDPLLRASSPEHQGKFARTDESVHIEYPPDSEMPAQPVVQGRGGMHFKRTLAQFSLENKVSLVTGGARGLGLVMGQGLVASGSDLAIVDLNKAEAEEQAGKLVEQFRKENPGLEQMPNVTAHYADVSNPTSVQEALAEILEKHKRIDNLVTSAGFTENFEAISYPFDRMKKLWGVNVDGTYLFATGVAKHLMERKAPGSIVMIGSMSGSIVNVPQPQAPYNAAKAAVRHLAASLAVEWAAQDIRVNCISPGYMLTALTRKILDENPQLRDKWISLIPAGKMGTPEDLMGAVTFLLSDASKYITGADLRVDGGYTLT